MRVNFYLVSSRHIQHVEHHNHRNLHFQQLSRQVKITLEIAGINNIDNQFGFILEDIVAGNAFVLTGS